MQKLGDRIVYSATDLVGYLECEHLTTLERAVFVTDLERPHRDDPELQVLQERGEEHERNYLAHLQALGRTVVEGRLPKVAGDGLDQLARIERDAALTRRLMAEGADVIYQATLFDGTWLGYADFLLRTDGASDLGDHHYEVADTKLARRVKGGALLQMCVYSDLLERWQGRAPERIHVALGGSGHKVESHRLGDYGAYYRSVKRRFLESVAPDQPLAYPLPVVPEPVGHCGVCRWEGHCAILRRDADHLSLVAGMRSDLANRLTDAGIPTLTALATLAAPLPELAKVSGASLASVHQQARLQLASRGVTPPLYEYLPVEENRGLCALPEPRRGDLFFDMEGDPFAEEDGLEYLFGVWDPLVPSDAGEPTFRSWWAHDRGQEKAAFEGFIDFVMERWRDDPSIHVYHYAAYERGRMGMLSTRHATREAEVDQMFRDGLFVDLFGVVKQALRIGTESYSIKRLEPLYALERVVPLQDAGSSVVAYEKYIRSVTAGAPDAAILDQIADYNRDDCRSNAELRDWLEGRRAELEARRGEPLTRRTIEATPDKPLREDQLRVRALAARLTVDVPVEPAAREGQPETQGRWLLANLLEWHHREEKVEWWAFFARRDMSDEDLVQDEESIGQLTLVGEVGRENRSIIHRYRFDPEQPYRLKVGDKPANPRTESGAGTIVALDALAGTIDIRASGWPGRPHPTSLIPGKPVTADPQKGALERLGALVAEHGLAGHGPYRGARELLLREYPRAGQVPGDPLLWPGEAVTAGARRLVVALDASVLPAQGPPGSGKTFTGAEMILELVRRGQKVGITAFTHRAIANLLDEVIRHAAESGIAVSAIRKVDADETEPEDPTYGWSTDNSAVAEALASGEVHIAAGTAWVWSRAEFEGAVDTLFVDEAGQMSLANVIAVAGAARNLVLLGDPQQLSQVKKGAHPPGADLSSLEHVLNGEPVIDPSRGIFLADTWRLHPDVNAFTSAAFYKGQLQSAAVARGQALDAPGQLTGTGVRWIPVTHAGNHNASEEEAEVIVGLYADLLRGRWTDQHGVDRPITPRDVLVIAPYNAQVELLTGLLRPVAADAGAGAGEPWVATVDKIQGQEGAVAIYSMATSSQNEMPRTLEFLFSLNRLNVATSRGRCLAVVVASPELLKVRVHTPLQMRLASAMCAFVEVAAAQAVR